MNKRKDRRSKEFLNKHRLECKSHYHRNKKYYLERNKKIVIKKYQWLCDYKESSGCIDCGIKYPHYVLEFDHRESKPVNRVANLVNYGWSRIKSEIEKCDIVCANCHNIRTWIRRNNAPSSNRQDTSL